jgi:hypothetical protein
LFGIGFTGLLKGDRVRRREYGKTARRRRRPAKDIVHKTVWTIFSHLERSGTTGIATLVESDGTVSGRAQSFQTIPPPAGELRPAVQQHDDRAALGTAQERVENEIPQAWTESDPSRLPSVGSGADFRLHRRGRTKSALR